MLYYVFIINGGSVWQEVGVQNSADIGRLSALPSLFTVVGAGIYWLVGKRSARLQLSLFLTLIGGGLIIMGLIHDWRGMIAGMIVQQTGVGMAVPVLIGWVQNYLPFAHRGRGMGIWTACFFFGQFLSPVVVGLVRMGAGTMQGAFVITGAIGLAGALIVNLVLAARRTPSAS
jgi:MFS family permease